MCVRFAVAKELATDSRQDGGDGDVRRTSGTYKTDKSKKEERKNKGSAAGSTASADASNRSIIAASIPQRKLVASSFKFWCKFMY